MSVSACLTDHEIQHLVDQRASAIERQRAEGHAADCRACRSQLVAAWHERRAASEIEAATVPAHLRHRVQGFVPKTSQPTAAKPSPWQQPRIWLPLAAVLVISVLALQAPRWFDLDANRTPVLRGEAHASVDLLSPAAGAVVDVDDGLTTFAWRTSDDSATYRLVILDGAGDRVFETEAVGASWQVEATELGAGDFYWTVSVVRADGSSASADQRHLRIVE